MKYTAELKLTGNNTGIEIPDAVLDELGAGKRPRLKVTLNGYSFQVTPGSMGGKVMIPVSKARREAAGAKGGEMLEVELEVDDQPVEIEVPEDFATALKTEGLRPAFDKLAPSHRKEHVRAINEAKSEQTRQRRIAKAIEMVRAKSK